MRWREPMFPGSVLELQLGGACRAIAAVRSLLPSAAAPSQINQPQTCSRPNRESNGGRQIHLGDGSHGLKRMHAVASFCFLWRQLTGSLQGASKVILSPLTTRSANLSLPRPKRRGVRHRFVGTTLFRRLTAVPVPRRDFSSGRVPPGSSDPTTVRNQRGACLHRVPGNCWFVA
jgi:hypothetical protein